MTEQRLAQTLPEPTAKDIGVVSTLQLSDEIHIVYDPLEPKESEQVTTSVSLSNSKEDETTAMGPPPSQPKVRAIFSLASSWYNLSLSSAAAVLSSNGAASPATRALVSIHRTSA